MHNHSIQSLYTVHSALASYLTHEKSKIVIAPLLAPITTFWHECAKASPRRSIGSQHTLRQAPSG
jgi:hypothetical protein